MSLQFQSCNPAQDRRPRRDFGWVFGFRATERQRATGWGSANAVRRAACSLPGPTSMPGYAPLHHTRGIWQSFAILVDQLAVARRPICLILWFAACFVSWSLAAVDGRMACVSTVGTYSLLCVGLVHNSNLPCVQRRRALSALGSQCASDPPPSISAT